MNLVLHLSPDVEARLKQHAAVAGKPLETIALEALEERLASTTEELANSKLSDEQWKKKFSETLAGLPTSEAWFVDDSRERIYEGRGE